MPLLATTVNKQSCFIYALVREAESRSELVSNIFRYRNDDTNCWRNNANKTPMKELTEIYARWVSHPASYIRLHQCANWFASKIVPGKPTRVIDVITLAQIVAHCPPNSKRWANHESHLRPRCDPDRLHAFWEFALEMWAMEEELDLVCPWGNIPTMSPIEATAALRFNLSYWFGNITPAVCICRCVGSAITDRLDFIETMRARLSA